jgi:hypothetical protein
MKQIKVSIPDNLLTQLEEAAAKEGRSLSDEVRRRLMGTAGHIDLGRPDIDELLEIIFNMVIGAEAATQMRWDKDPATAFLLQLAIPKLLQRYGAKEVDEIPQPLVTMSTNPAEIAIALEAIVYFKRRYDVSMTKERRKIDEQMASTLRETMNLEPRSSGECQAAFDELRKETATPTEPNVEGEKDHDQ